MPLHPEQLRLGEVTVKSLWACPAGAVVGDPVFQTVGINTVDIADCTDGNKMPAEGIISKKVSGTTCYVTNHGLVRRTGWGLDPDNDYFVGSGQVVKGDAVPGFPGTRIQPIGRARSAEELIVDVRSVVSIN